MAPGSSASKSLENTPTWALALVCAVFVIISILIEHSLHSLGKYLQKRHKKALSEALEKIKAELMLLGFISLLLTVGTNHIAKICIPPKLGEVMLPCRKKEVDVAKKGGGGGDDRRKLLSYAQDQLWHRVLAAAEGDDKCGEHGKVAMVSAQGLHQLHIFIFMLAVFHVLYSGIVVALGQAKMKKWKAWESETSSFEYQFTNDPARFRFTRQTSFVRRHSGFSRMPGIRWIVAFFRQFLGSVSKVDYLTMRHGFINAHIAPNGNFDFHKYIKRSMEDDFKVIVGISIPLWLFAVIFLLLNVYNWYTLTWLTLAPLFILLLVGTKLELIIMEMAQEIQDRNTVVKGAPVVEPNNKYFWFNRPQWILYLIHFTLFQNAFQMAYFLWICFEFGITSCFHENLATMIVRVLIGVALPIVSSYITFPLYALITQMGSHMKKTIFEEQTAKALKKWQKAARERHKLKKQSGAGGSVSGENTPSRGTSPLHLLHKHKHMHSHDSQSQSHADLESVTNSPTSTYLSDTDLSDMDGSTHDGFQIRPVQPHQNDHHHQQQQQQPQQQQLPRNTDLESHNLDFSFVKP